MPRKYLLVILLFIFVLAGCSTPAAQPPAEEPAPVEEEVEESENEAEEPGRTLVLADIDDDDPVEKIAELQPIADYLAERLSEYGITEGQVKVAPDIDTMVEWVAAGEVDLFYDSPFPSAVVAAEGGAVPVARGWRGGEPVYHSLFFALAESGVESLDDLQGGVVSYDEPGSTSGFLLPTAYLVQNGYNVVEVDSPEGSVGDDEIGYVFSEDDENTIEWVLSGIVDAGVVDNLTYADDIPEETQADLVILAETEDVPRRFMMGGGHLDADLLAAIQDVLIEMENDPEAAPLLDELKTLKFDVFEDPQATLDQMIELLELVESN